jgi:hypothetical protein
MLKFAQLVKIYQLFMELTPSLSCLQEHAIGPYPMPDESGPQLHILLQ